MRLAILGLVIALAATVGTRVWLPPVASIPDARATVTAESGAIEASRAIAAGRTFLLLQDEREQRLQEKVDRALARAFGSRAVVAVNLELEPRTETRSGVNLPETGLTPSLVESAPVNSASISAAAGGRLRPRPGDGVHKREIDPVLYGKRVELQLAPTVRRITAAIALDANVYASAAARQDAANAVTAIVKQAVGFDPARGDELPDPVFTAFVTADSSAPAGAIWWVATCAVLGLAFVVGGVWMVRSGRQRGACGARGARGVTHQRDIEAAIDQDPEAVARLLGNWAVEARR